MKTHFGFWWPCLPHARMDSPMGIALQCMVFGYQEFLRSFVGPIASIPEAIRVSTIKRSFGEFGSRSMTPRGNCAAEEFFGLV